MRHSSEFIEERNQKIIAFINKNQTVTVHALCDAFALPQSTARAILATLAKEGVILRTHGGACSLPTAPAAPVRPIEHSLSEDICEYKAKTEISRLAASLIEEGDTIAICGGTTTHLFAQFLCDKKNITVVTNSLLVAHCLMGCSNIDVRVSGGILNHKKGSFYGKTTEAFFQSVYISKFIFSADAINVSAGATARESNVSALESQIITRSECPILIADSTKFHKQLAIDTIASFDYIQYLITDNRIDPAILNDLHQKNVHTLVASV